MQQVHAPADSSHRSCPCKNIAISLSSFTAAEYGDVFSLLSRGGDLSIIAAREDSAGNTPLHLAAQHGHVALVSLLLKYSNVNAASGGATPLHRASYSGAVGAIRVMLEDSSMDLLVKDTSFGDQATPLHKACYAGRFLVVQLLLDALQESTRSLTTLSIALRARDVNGRTPLEAARHFAQMRSEDRPNVVRWNQVAGGRPDWEMCVKLLQLHERTGWNDTKPTQCLAALKPLPTFMKMERWSCDHISCQPGQVCPTASWEESIRRTLSLASRQPPPSPCTTDTTITTDDTAMCNTNPVSDAPATKALRATSVVSDDTARTSSSPESTTGIVGRACSDCNTICVALYAKGKGLVCKSCLRRH